MAKKKPLINLFAPSEFTGINIAMVCVHLDIGNKKVFAEPAPVDIDELTPDELFDWHKIGIGCDCQLCHKK